MYVCDGNKYGSSFHDFYYLVAASPVTKNTSNYLQNTAQSDTSVYTAQCAQ